MPEPLKTRTKEEIAREYSNLATKAGHAAYQIVTIQKDIDLMQVTMRDLNIEAATAARREAEAAKPSEATTNA